MNNPWPRLLGFYGFKGFDEFANIISEQQKLGSEFQKGAMMPDKGGALGELIG
jgi:hypothetical protein